MLPMIFRNNCMEDLFDFPRFDSFEKDFRPIANLMKTDIKEEENDYLMDIDIPGYNKDNIEIMLNDGYLNIKASKNEEKEEKDENSKVLRKERMSGMMERSYYVGEDIKEDDIKAKYENGVLSLTIPKKQIEQKEQKKIAIA